MSVIKKLIITAICIAFCYVLPAALHPMGLGQVLSPMHIPVLVCGLICGPGYGIACGIIGPFLSSLLSGMPPLTMLITMIPELIAYGFFCGVFLNGIKTDSLLANIYLAMIPAMVLGRLVGCIFKAGYVIVLSGLEAFSLTQIATAYFITTLPGIIVHLLFVPLLIVTLKEEKLIKVKTK